MSSGRGAAQAGGRKQRGCDKCCVHDDPRRYLVLQGRFASIACQLRRQAFRRARGYQQLVRGGRDAQGVDRNRKTALTRA